MRKMKQWQRGDYYVQEIQDKRDIHEFNVILNNEVIVTIMPDDITEMNETIRKLDENESMINVKDKNGESFNL
ncbi:hypothetical protein ACFOLA_03055 [Salinicoccus hispanicus]|uniref:Uncharacterized protein n=1 Tax=Salinicoccus hispanicus TaxID=157225 RepID=A0A6N8TZS8_9STAP|nr:hypothetical protein [Salinicoccus hispanicus]MXQ50557.1 hypothetical protein [Salinicoccus hispanicus]